MKNDFTINKIPSIFLLFISLLIVYFSKDVGIFWDNVLFVSKVGTSLYNNGIFNWAAIPMDIDSGHPPFIGSYMALGWTVFGRSLLVSHLLMLPFVFGVMLQILRTCSYFVGDIKSIFLLFLLVVIDPTLLAQLVQVNPELIQMFFFFLALNGILYNNSWQKTLGLAFLGLVSFRGMMLCAGIFLIDISLHLFVRKERFQQFFTLKNLVIYTLGASPAIGYLVWRLLVRGWVFSNPLEMWGNYWAYTSGGDFVYTIARNSVVLAHKFLDFGRIVPFALVVFTLIVKRKNEIFKQNASLIIILVFSTFVVVIVSLLAKNPMGHRYFLPSYIAMAILCFNILKEYKYQKSIYVVVVVALLTGNLWVYPDKIAQGWDASLAHLPYWDLRTKAIKYLDDNDISINETETFFPNYNSIDEIEHNGDLRKMKGFTGNSNFVMYSNVYNVSDEVIDDLKENYTIVQSFEKMNVRVDILKKNNTSRL